MGSLFPCEAGSPIPRLQVYVCMWLGRCPQPLSRGPLGAWSPSKPSLTSQASLCLHPSAICLAVAPAGPLAACSLSNLLLGRSPPTPCPNAGTSPSVLHLGCPDPWPASVELLPSEAHRLIVTLPSSTRSPSALLGGLWSTLLLGPLTSSRVAFHSAAATSSQGRGCRCRTSDS